MLPSKSQDFLFYSQCFKILHFPIVVKHSFYKKKINKKKKKRNKLKILKPLPTKRKGPQTLSKLVVRCGGSNAGAVLRWGGLCTSTPRSDGH